MAWTDVGVGGGIYYECLHYGDTSPSCDAPPTGISCVSRPLVCVSVTTVIGGLSTNFSKAGVRKLIVKLTPRGKRLLSSNRLEVTAIGTFAPRGNPTMSATKSFSLRR